MMHHRLRPPSRVLLRLRPLAPLGTRGNFACRDRAITEAWEGYQRRRQRRQSAIGNAVAILAVLALCAGVTLLIFPGSPVQAATGVVLLVAAIVGLMTGASI